MNRVILGLATAVCLLATTAHAQVAAAKDVADTSFVTADGQRTLQLSTTIRHTA